MEIQREIHNELLASYKKNFSNFDLFILIEGSFEYRRNFIISNTTKTFIEMKNEFAYFDNNALVSLFTHSFLFEHIYIFQKACFEFELIHSKPLQESLKKNKKNLLTLWKVFNIEAKVLT